MSITSDRPTGHDVSTVAPGTDRTTEAPPRRRSHRGLLGWGAVAAGVLAAGALAVATLWGGGSDAPDTVPAHPGIIEHGSPRAIEGSVEDSPAVPAGPGIAEHGSPRAIDGTVEAPLPPSAEDTGSNVADMPPVATRGTASEVVDEEADQPPATPSPMVSRKDPPL